MIRFRTDGQPIGSPVRFPSRMYGDIRTFHTGHETFVLVSPYADPTKNDVDGSSPRRFDRSSLRQPRPREDSCALEGTDSVLDTMVSITKARPSAIVVIATRYGPAQLQIVRVRL
jgi:hypothetical protein